MATDFKNSSLATNLVSFWKLDEASGTRVDAHSSNDLDDINTVLQGTINGDNAADFEADNSERLTIQSGDQAGLSISGDISVYAIVEPESLPSGGAEMWIISKYQGTAPRSGYGFGLNEASGNYNVHFRCASSSRQYTQTESDNFAFSTATVYRILAMCDVSASEVTFYVNGSFLSTNSMSKTLGGAIATGSNEFAVGGQSGSTNESFDGLMKKVAIWDRLLTSSEAADVTGNDLPYEAAASGIFIPKSTMI